MAGNGNTKKPESGLKSFVKSLAEVSPATRELTKNVKFGMFLGKKLRKSNPKPKAGPKPRKKPHSRAEQRKIADAELRAQNRAAAIKAGQKPVKEAPERPLTVREKIFGKKKKNNNKPKK